MKNANVESALARVFAVFESIPGPAGKNLRLVYQSILRLEAHLAGDGVSNGDALTGCPLRDLLGEWKMLSPQAAWSHLEAAFGTLRLSGSIQEIGATVERIRADLDLIGKSIQTEGEGA